MTDTARRLRMPPATCARITIGSIGAKTPGWYAASATRPGSRAPADAVAADRARCAPQ